MIRFAVLNEEEQSKSKEEESVEIQAEKCLGVYEGAIRLLQKGQLEESKGMLKDLIDSDLFQNIDNDSEIAARGTPLRRLQYLVYTNYAYILEQVAENALALQYYLKAIAFDCSDNSLWIKIGTMAADEKKLKLARYALESGLQQQRTDGVDNTATNNVFSNDWPDHDFTPSQWTCLETLCNVLYEIGDFIACEDYIQKALRVSPYFQRGLELQNLIHSQLQDGPDLTNFGRIALDTAPSNNIETSVKQLVLEDPSWITLGEKLLEEYKAMLADPDPDFCNQRLVIRTQKATSEDIDMGEVPLVIQEPVATMEVELATEEPVPPESKAMAEPFTQEPIEASGPAATVGDDVGDQGDKDTAETEQNAAIKRKRKEVEERSGLRTSKRVRDKLEQFEETKRKREEEEQEMLSKYRIVLSKFGMDIENAYISGANSGSLRAEQIFPSGLYGLLVTFNKHLERPNALVQASTIEHVQQQKTNHFAIFNVAKDEPPISSFYEDPVTLLDFIHRANEQNSGIVEYLCEYALVVLSGLPNSESLSNWQKRWPAGLQSVISSVVCLIEDQLLEYLNQETRSDESSHDTEQRITLELQLSICEMYLDEMVHAILHPFTVISRKGRGARKIDAEHVARVDKNFQRWMYLVGVGLEAPLTSSKWKIDSPRTTTWVRAAMLRFNWMLGRHAQCLGNASEAIARFELCFQQLKDDSSLDVHLPNCKYDTKVDAEKIQERLGRLKTHQYVLDSARLFDEKDYNAVMTRLEPIFLKKGEGNSMPGGANQKNLESDITDSIGGSLSERLELMGLLYKSCEALRDKEKQFHCISEMFVLVVETLVNTITDKSEATEVWFLFGQVSQILFLLRETLQAAPLSDLLHSLDDRLLQKLVCGVLAITRLGFVNILHQDRLVDDDIKLSYSDLLKNRPHLEQFNLVLVRVWLVLLLLLPGWIQEGLTSGSDNTDRTMSELLPLNMAPLDLKAMDLDFETTQRVLSQPLTTNSSTALGLYTCPSQELYMELIAQVHDDFGVREICGIDDNQLIKLALKVSSPMQGAFYRKEENQCYYCFYGISLSVDGQYPIEHSSEPVDFDKKAATEFFPLLERSLSDRVLRGQVRGDLKDAVDRVEEALGSPPYESNSILELNRQLIDAYLASEINFAEAIQVNSKNHLPTMLQPPSSKLPSVYRRIYAIQGKIFLAQFRNKAKNNQFKPLEDLQHAIDQFGTDIHVNPDSWDSWYSLATCYAFLADENLVFSASDIKNNFSKITDLQKRAFHCFSQAVKLTPKRCSRSSNNDISAGEHENQRTNNTSLSWDEPSQERDIDERVDLEDCEPRGSTDLGEQQHHTGMSKNSDHEWYQQQAAFWFDFGYLIHGIMSKPMRMEAMRRTEGLEAMSDTGDLVTISIPEPTEEQVYKFAAFCFKRSLMLNDQNWRTPLMLGKCIEKLAGKPSQVLTLYKIAADKVPHRSGQPGNEKIFEAAYKVISTLSKYLSEDRIKPSIVESLMTKTLAKSKLSAAEGESFIFDPPEEYLQVIQSDPPTEEDFQKKHKLHAFRLLCEGLARIRHTDKRHWHHRPVFRQAWILYHIYHDVERAKAEMLSLFQIKSNLKTLVSSVWKPEFERSGKHFIYVGEYTKFLIVLAKETSDVETLNSLARKIRRAHGLLLDLKEIWELLYDSYMSVLADLVGPDPVLAVAEVIPRTEFREKAAIYEAKMFEQAATLPGLAVLQRLCELKKLNDRMAPEGQMAHLLAVCYSKLFIEVGGADLYPKELVRQLSSNSEPHVTSRYGQAESGEKLMEEGDPAVEAQDESATSAKSALTTDEENDQDSMRLKIERLTTEGQADTDTASPTHPVQAVDIPLPSILIDGQEALETDQGSSESRREASDYSIGNITMDIPSSLDAPSSPALSAHAKEGDGASTIDVEPDIEDWRTRKKISAAELASRATVMCKAPPPSLKAPQTLQSKLAGPDSLPSQDEASATGVPSEESRADTVMASADKAVDEGSNHDHDQDQDQDQDPSADVKTTESTLTTEPASEKIARPLQPADPSAQSSKNKDDSGQEDTDVGKMPYSQRIEGDESPDGGRTSRTPSKRVSSRRNSKNEEDATMS